MEIKRVNRLSLVVSGLYVKSNDTNNMTSVEMNNDFIQWGWRLLLVKAAEKNLDFVD